MARRPFKGSGKGEQRRGLAPSLFFVPETCADRATAAAVSARSGTLDQAIEMVPDHDLVLITVLDQEAGQR